VTALRENRLLGPFKVWWAEWSVPDSTDCFLIAMASLNLSTNGPSISKSYKSIVDAPAPSGPAAASPTYGQWSLFAVSAPLVNAFQQDAGGKESVLKVQSTGGGIILS
jgi:hypothetical protein